MAEKLVPFNGEMVRAILDRRKTQMRSVIKVPRGSKLYGNPLQPIHHAKSGYADLGVTRQDAEGRLWPVDCPYGVPGSQLLVQEGIEKSTAGLVSWSASPCEGPRVDGEFVLWNWKKPKLSAQYMPRWACRILLEVTDVWVEKVQEISESDADAEGVVRRHLNNGWVMPSVYAGPIRPCEMAPSARHIYMHYWDCINAQRGDGWAVNPFVWARSFKRIDND